MMNDLKHSAGPRYVRSITASESTSEMNSNDRPYDNLTYQTIERTSKGLEVEEVEGQSGSLLKDICNVALGVAVIAASVVVPAGGPFLLGVGVHAVVNSLSNAGDGQWYWQRRDGLVAGVTVGLAAHFAILGKVIPSTLSILMGLAVGTDSLVGAIDQVGKTTDSVGSLVQQALIGPSSPLWGLLPWVIVAVILWKFVSSRGKQASDETDQAVQERTVDPLFEV